MFICSPCLEKNFMNFAYFTSYGKCESCEDTANCHDIPSKDLQKKVDVVLYEHDKNYHNVFNVPDTLYGVIPIYHNEKECSIKVYNGQYISYNDGEVGIVNNEDDHCAKFYKIR